jgi:antirestriction protein ArdC
MSNANLNKARELLIKKYTDALKQNILPWERGWYRDLPRNAITKTEYRGVNSLLLSFIAEERGYSGNRWCTFNQIADKDKKYHPKEQWHLKKGSESVPVEYWYVYNTVERKKYTFPEYNKVIISDPERIEEFRLCSRVYLVFNEDCIEGISKELPTENQNIDKLEIIDKIIVNMGVNYEEKGNQAFYNSLNDIVVIPPMEHFKNEYYYCATQLHELCHATGHSSRLNRQLGNGFGSEEYAKEELRAEISSSFLMQEFKLEYDDKHIENHIAYIQSWIKVLENDPNELFRAIQDANKIVEYVEEKGEITKYNEPVLETVAVSNDDYEIEM